MHGGEYPARQDKHGPSQNYHSYFQTQMYGYSTRCTMAGEPGGRVMHDFIRVLYVDDEPVLLEIGKTFLEKVNNFSVDTLTSATEALTCISTKQYDVIISDYQMPGMDGIEFLQKVRESGSNVPFILFTGKGREEVVIEAINNGVDFYLQKGGQPKAMFAELAHKVSQAVQRRRAEMSLFESERRYRLLAEHVRDVIMIADMDMRLTYISPSVTALRGVTPEEALNESIEGVMTSESYQKLMKQRDAGIRKMQSGGPIDDFHLQELEFYKSDGSTVWTEMVISLIFGPGKRPVGVVGVIRDISERKKAQEALSESEERFRAIVETSPDMIWEIDMQGNFRYVSPQILTVMGYPAEAVIGKSVLCLVPEEKFAVAKQALMRCINLEGPLVPFEVPARHWDGHDMFLEIRPSIAGTDGIPAGFRGMAVDITERRKEEEALRHANRQLGLLSRMTRHDILNNLSIASGFMEVAKMNTGNPELLRCLEGTDSAIINIESQIEFTRIYEDIGAHDPQWIGLATIMPRDYVPATVTLTDDVEGVVVFADPMLEKVFFSLLDNSVRHGQRVTEIRVSYHQSGMDLVVVWEDNGVGIAPDEKERIFEWGFGKNTGFGLFLVREILSLSGIAITETGEEGTGTRFEIVVPDGGYRFMDES